MLFFFCLKLYSLVKYVILIYDSGVCDEKEALSPVAQVVSKKDTGALGLKNKSEKRWDATTTKGVAKKVAPNDIIPLKDGIIFEALGEKITIKANKSLKVGKNAFIKLHKKAVIKVKGVNGNAKKKIVKAIKKQTKATVK